MEDSSPKPVRVSFQEDEEAHPWLTLLLDAYLIFDEGIFEGILSEEEKGRTLACKKGCFACCSTHKNIPVYPMELVGVTWYAAEKVRHPRRKN